MSLDTTSQEADQRDDGLLEAEVLASPLHIALQDFVSEFGDDLLQSLNRANPPVYTGQARAHRQIVLAGLKRKLFPAQAETVHAVAELLLNQDEPAAIVNGEMGCGKTTVGAAVAAVFKAEGYRRTLVLSPPHLVYKWRREILETVPGAKVWVLNGPDTLVKLLKLREQLNSPDKGHEFYVLGRVRMRMGFHWRPSFATKRTRGGLVGMCPHCGHVIVDTDGEPVSVDLLQIEESRRKCERGSCESPLWTLMRPRTLSNEDQSDAVLKALKRIPTIGPVSAQRLVARFGDSFLASMLGDNIHEFINLMDGKGELVFSDRQAHRMERAMANMEFGFGEGGYQPSEFIKRYLPQGTFDLLIADEAHEYKNGGSAQGQAMGVLAAKAKKVLLLTGTLMGGYGDDLFYLLFRTLTSKMIEDGYRPKQGSLTSAAMAFMRDHGVLKDIYTESDGPAHKTAKGSKVSVRTVKAPGFGPKGVLRYVLPYTVFLKLKDIGSVLPPYEEEFREVAMAPEQATAYNTLSQRLTSELKQALAKRDTTLLGVVLNALLAWPDTCFRPETVFHPRNRAVLAFVPSQFNELEATPKERELIKVCKQEKAQGRKTLVYSVYTGRRDTTSRLKALLEQQGLKTAVLRASVDASRREDWIAEQLDRGIDVLISNPELVKTGLDLLDFPTIVFMQSGWNVYSLQQAARRSWRIGQKYAVKVIFLGYARTSQMTCLGLMAKKIMVSQSTSGDVPDSGLDVLNHDGDSVEVALARQLVH